jgi:hypothetical protein
MPTVQLPGADHLSVYTAPPIQIYPLQATLHFQKDFLAILPYPRKK